LSGNLFIFYLLVLNADTLKRLRVTLTLIMVLMVAISVEGICAYHFGYRGEELIVEEALPDVAPGETPTDAPTSVAGKNVVRRVRSRGFLHDPNDLAQALVATLPFVFFFRRPGKSLANALRVWLPTVLMLYAVALTRSRGGLLALLVLTFLSLRGRMNAAVSLVTTIAGALGALGIGILGGRAGGMDASGESRVEAWRSGWEMLKSSPIWGVGYGFFGDHLHGRVAHNSSVHCYAELGLVGYFIWLGILVLAFQEMTALGRAEPETEGEEQICALARGALLSLVAFLVAAFFLSRAYSTVLFLLVGIATAVNELGRKRGLVSGPFRLVRWGALVGAVEFGTISFLYVLGRILP
jgi:O-antigen ligase